MKKVAPVVIVIIVCSYLGAYVTALMFGVMSDSPFFAKVILFIGGLAVVSVIVALIYTLVERLREIDKEDEDDLSKY